MVKKMQANKGCLHFLKTPQRIWLKINKNSINGHHINAKKKLKPFIIFLICFFLVLFSLFNIPPYSWAKTGLTASVTPKNLERGQNLFVSGVLMGDDKSGKTIALQVTDVQGNLMTTMSSTTDDDGFYDYTWQIPDNCSIGKHDLTSSYALLTATENFMVKLAAPQKYGGKISTMIAELIILRSTRTHTIFYDLIRYMHNSNFILAN